VRDRQPLEGGSECPGVDDADESVRAAVWTAYDDIAGAYADRREVGPEATLAERLGERLDAGARLLDAGCGEGTPGLAGHGFERIGLDAAAEQCRRATAAMPGRVLRGDLAALPLAADSVDAVVSLYALIHVPSGDHPAVYREFARVLSPGGRLVVSVGESPWQGRNEDWLDTGTEMRWDMPGVDEATEGLADAGFAVREHHAPDEDLGGEHPILVAQLSE